MANSIRKVTSRTGSPFSNEYGRLSLIKVGDDYFLEMGDCFGPDYFGPLTQAQVDAFNTLRGVTPAGPLDLFSE